VTESANAQTRRSVPYSYASGGSHTGVCRLLRAAVFISYFRLVYAHNVSARKFIRT